MWVLFEPTTIGLIAPPGFRSECPLFSPKRTFRNGDLDSVRMSAFGHKQSFRIYAYTCILTVNECLLSAKSGRSRLISSALRQRHYSRTGSNMSSSLVVEIMSWGRPRRSAVAATTARIGSRGWRRVTLRVRLPAHPGEAWSSASRLRARPQPPRPARSHPSPRAVEAPGPP